MHIGTQAPSSIAVAEGGTVSMAWKHAINGRKSISVHLLYVPRSSLLHE
jgi:hypothetical protein